LSVAAASSASKAAYPESDCSRRLHTLPHLAKNRGCPLESVGSQVGECSEAFARASYQLGLLVTTPPRR